MQWIRLSLRDSQRNLQLVQKEPNRGGVEIGSTGLEVFSGVLGGDIVEHNRDWEGTERFNIVDRMRRGDSTCAATLAAVTLPVVATEFHVDAKEGAMLPGSLRSIRESITTGWASGESARHARSLAVFWRLV